MSKRSKSSNNLLEVKNIKHYFPITKGVIIRKNIGTVKAVDGISFSIGEKEIAIDYLEKALKINQKID